MFRSSTNFEKLLGEFILLKSVQNVGSLQVAINRLQIRRRAIINWNRIGQRFCKFAISYVKVMFSKHLYLKNIFAFSFVHCLDATLSMTFCTTLEYHIKCVIITVSFI